MLWCHWLRYREHWPCMHEDGEIILIILHLFYVSSPELCQPHSINIFRLPLLFLMKLLLNAETLSIFCIFQQLLCPVREKLRCQFNYPPHTWHLSRSQGSAPGTTHHQQISSDHLFIICSATGSQADWFKSWSWIPEHGDGGSPPPHGRSKKLFENQLSIQAAAEPESWSQI